MNTTQPPTVFVPWGDRINFRDGEILFKVRLNQGLTEWVEIRMLVGIARDDFANYCVKRSLSLAEHVEDFYGEVLFENAHSWPTWIEGEAWPNFILHPGQSLFISKQGFVDYFDGKGEDDGR